MFKYNNVCCHHALKDHETPLNGCLRLFAPCSIVKMYQLTFLVKLLLAHMFFKAKFELHISRWKKTITKCYKFSYFHRIHLIAFSFLPAELLNVKRRRILKDDAVPTIFCYSQEVKERRKNSYHVETGRLICIYIDWLLHDTIFYWELFSNKTIVRLLMAATERNREFKKAQLSSLKFWV